MPPNNRIGVEYKSNIPSLPLDMKVAEGSDITLKDIKEAISQTKTKFKMVQIEWDDTIQATTYGAAMLIKPEILDDPDLEEEYLSREGSPEEFFGKRYGISKEELDETLAKNYEQIIRFAPVLENIQNFFAWTHVWKNVHINFKHRFDGIALHKDIRSVIGGIQDGSNLYFHYDGFDPDKISDTDAEFIFCRNVAPLYDKISRVMKKPNMVYLTSLMDSGFDIDFIAAYNATAKFTPNGRPIAACDSNIFFYMENFYHANRHI